jgi:hypothetical protein
MTGAAEAGNGGTVGGSVGLRAVATGAAYLGVEMRPLAASSVPHDPHVSPLGVGVENKLLSL